MAEEAARREEEKSKAVNEFDKENIECAIENMKELKEKFKKRDKQTEDALKVDERTLQIRISQ